MKASQVIKELEALKKELGDVEVGLYNNEVCEYVFVDSIGKNTNMENKPYICFEPGDVIY